MPSGTFHLMRQAEQRWWYSVALFVLVGLIAAVRYCGPAPRPSSAEGGVAAGRALQSLALILGEDQKPHRAGTKENQELRIRLLGMLDELGLETQLFPFPIPEEGRKRLAERKLDLQFDSSLTNLVVRIPGQRRSRPVILASHYDSAIDAPGAGDAGQCVAALLETARALRDQPLHYETWLLLTDAEEFGLWGASQFMQQGHRPWGDGAPVVINFDARGCRGAALLYQTHEDNLAAMQLASRAIARPQVSTSLMVNVYKSLPNGTDFTVFQQAGWCGWNFAVVAGADRYHTAGDNLTNLSARSVQHFASHAYQLLQALDRLTPAALLELDRSEPAVFFDLLGWLLVVYPMSWNGWHLALVAACWCALWWIAARGANVRLKPLAVAWVVGLTVMIALASYAAGWIVVRGLQAADLSPRNFVTGYEVLMLIFPLIALAMHFGLGRGVSRIANLWETMQAIALIYGLIGAAACWWLPGGAYLFLWPSLWLLVLLLVGANWLPPALTALAEDEELVDRYSRGLVLLAALVPALLYAPTYVLLAQTLGPRAGMLIAAAAAVMLLPTLIAWPRPRHSTPA